MKYELPEKFKIRIDTPQQEKSCLFILHAYGVHWNNNCYITDDSLFSYYEWGYLYINNGYITFGIEDDYRQHYSEITVEAILKL